MRIPKTIRWIFICAIILLALLTLYRVIIFSVFENMFSGVSGGGLSSFIYGFRFDIQLIAAFTLFMFVLGLWPNLHFFKWNTGKYTALVLYTIFIFILMMFCLLDFVYILQFNERLQGNVISDIVKGTDRWNKLANGPAFTVGFAVAIVVTALVIFLFYKLHSRITKEKVKHKHARKGYAQIILISVCIIAIWGRVAINRFDTTFAARQLGIAAYKLALSPIASFTSTLPIRSDEE